MKTVLSLVLLLATTSSWATEVGGVRFAESIKLEDQDLVLNGAGLRKKFFVNVYAAGLYLPEQTAEAEQAVTMPGAKRMSMQFIHDKVSAEKIRKGWTEGFHRNQTKAQMENLQLRLGDFNALFEDMKKGDEVVIDYLPGLGTRVSVKGHIKGIIPGEDFVQALFRVWLGDFPADKGLKKGLLGGA